MDRCDGCGNRIDTSVEEYTRLPAHLFCQRCMDDASNVLCEAGIEAEGLDDTEEQVRSPSSGEPVHSSSIRSEALEEALKPFAEIALYRDVRPDGPDMIDGPDLAITPTDVRRARDALTKLRGQK